MKLSNGYIRPGIVKSVDIDGNVRAISPGLFSIESESDVDKLPPIMPGFIGGGPGIVSVPEVGEEIWILSFTDNPLQLFWFKKNQSPTSILDIENIGRNSEVLCNKKTEKGNALLYYSDSSGWVFGGKDAKVTLTPDGSILLDSSINEKSIHINDKTISIGSAEESAHPAAYGDTIEEILTSLCELLMSVATSAVTNPYTASLGMEILYKLPSISEKIADISSDTVTID